MKTSEDLFQLIKSLSRSEKGYFKKFAALHTREENTYMKLFDAIEKQEVYEEAKAIKELRLKKPLKNFSVLKSYLYSFIMKSLRMYHSQRSTGLYLKEELEYIEILYEKGLFKQCEKIIQKAKVVAVKHEAFPFVLEIFKWEILIMGANSYVGITKEEVKKLYAFADENADKYKNENAFKYFISVLAYKRKETKFMREDKDRKGGGEIQKSSFLKKEALARSSSALSLFYQFHCFNYYDQQNVHKSLEYSGKLVGLLETNSQQVKENPRMYVVTLYNILMTQLTLKKYNDPLEIVEKLRSLKSNWESTQGWITYTALDAEMNLCIANGRFDKGLKLIAEAEELLKKQNIIARHKQLEMEFYKMFFIIYFGSGKYSKANIYLNKIINYPLVGFRIDLHVFARIMSLIVHFELGNTDLLTYTVKSTYRFLYKRKRLYKFETIILDFVKAKLSKMKTRKEQIAAFKELKTAAEKIANDTYESQAFMNFDFISWVDSKIEGRSFEEILKRKIKAI